LAYRYDNVKAMFASVVDICLLGDIVVYF